jgi:Mrp family chromosome partitioning ATPase
MVFNVIFLRMSLEEIGNNLKAGSSLSQKLFARGDIIFVVASLSLLCGFVLPLGGKMLDLLWVVDLCLATMVIVIAFSARDSGELSSFPVLLATATLLRIVTGVASARMIVLDGVGSTIITAVGEFISTGSHIWTLMIMCICAVVVWAIISMSAKRISAASAMFISDILPIKLIGVESDLNTRMIDLDEAANLRERIAREKQFYLNMTGAAKLLHCDGAIAGLVVIISIGGQWVVSSMNRSGAVSGIEEYTVLESGMAVLMLLPAVLVAISSAYLLSKSNLSISAAEEREEKQTSEKVEVVSEETGKKETVELLNPDFTKVPQGKRKVVESTDAAVGDTVVSDESIASFEPIIDEAKEIRTESKEAYPKETALLEETESTQEKGDGITLVLDEFEDIEDYYGKIVKLVCDAPKSSSAILFAAESVDELPVTVAVNVGIKSVQEGFRTLLIDGDPEREAVAMVFDVKPENAAKDSVETCIGDLFVWTAGKGDEKGPSVSDMISGMASKYERVIVYCPNMQGAGVGNAAAAACDGAIVFSEDGEVNEELAEVLKKNGCKVIASVKQYQEVL